MPDLCGFFLDTQAPAATECELPPTRFLYIYTSWIWKRIQFGDTPPISPEEMRATPVGDNRSKDADHRDPALASLHRVACLFTILLMVAGGLCAWRMAGFGAGLGVLALMAFSPMQIHFSQHALIDGFFAFWALMCIWTTWECLRAPGSKGWLAAHGIFLALMAMAKLENAFFVCCGLGAVVFANRWLKIGTVSPKFLVVSICGPLFGIAILISLAGGLDTFVSIYKILVAKAQNLQYAKLTGDGPWYRYFLDMLTMSPIVVLLAIGALFKLTPARKEITFLAVFVAASYLIMCNVKYGMNLRYTSIWELPFRLAAFLLVWELCAKLKHRQWLAATVLVAGLCAYDLRQYEIIASDPNRPLYELVPNDLLKLVHILKTPADL
jgi:4-amino-4-deoxy-L-arabinose transferase-like glycosyltransferase